MSRKDTGRLRSRLWNDRKMSAGKEVFSAGESMKAWRSQTSRTVVAVYTAEDAGLDSSFPWYASCETHSNALGCATKALALSAARETSQWCDGCKDELNERVGLATSRKQG